MIFDENNFVKLFPQYRTEQDCVKALGAKYKRFLVTDNNRPEDSDVDEFVKFVRKLQKKEKHKKQKCWLHFHCLAGMGRTTTFMSLYEMMVTASSDMLPLDEILARQHKAGGADLTHMWYSPDPEGWLNFLKNFHGYAKDEKDGYVSGKLWSEWVSSKKINAYEEGPA